MRQKLIALLVFSMLASPALADRPILLVTPRGVWQAEVTDGVPGPFVAKPYDVIVQGFSNVPVPPDEPDPPVPPVPPTEDPVIKQVKALSGAPYLKDKAEGTAVAALVDALVKLTLTGARFKEALEMAAPIADAQMQSGGRITRWSKSVLAVTTDAAKIKAGVVAAWDIAQTSLDSIGAAYAQPADAAVTGEALDWMLIIEMLRIIIPLIMRLFFPEG